MMAGRSGFSRDIPAKESRLKALPRKALLRSGSRDGDHAAGFGLAV